MWRAHSSNVGCLIITPPKFLTIFLFFRGVSIPIVNSWNPMAGLFLESVWFSNLITYANKRFFFTIIFPPKTHHLSPMCPPYVFPSFSTMFSDAWPTRRLPTSPSWWPPCWRSSRRRSDGKAPWRARRPAREVATGVCYREWSLKQ